MTTKSACVAGLLLCGHPHCKLGTLGVRRGLHGLLIGTKRSWQGKGMVQVQTVDSTADRANVLVDPVL